MKKIYLLGLMALSLSVNAQKAGEWLSTDTFKTKTTNIVIRHSNSMNDCDTIIVNGKKMYGSLQSGITSTYSKEGKFKYSDTHFYLYDSSNGRSLQKDYWKNRLDIQFDQTGKNIYRVDLIIDGNYVKTYK